MKSLWYWRLAIIRCLIYGGVVMWGVFKAGVEGYDRWADMSAMTHTKLLGDMGMGFAGVILAFLDSSIQRLSADKPEYDRQAAVRKDEQARVAVLDKTEKEP